MVPREGNTNRRRNRHPRWHRPVGPDGYEGHVTFYIEVPDVGASLDQVEKLGGTKVMGPETMTEDLTIGLFNDPEGHLIGLVQSARRQPLRSRAGAPNFSARDCSARDKCRRRTARLSLRGLSDLRVA